MERLARLSQPWVPLLACPAVRGKWLRSALLDKPAVAPVGTGRLSITLSMSMVLLGGCTPCGEPSQYAPPASSHEIRNPRAAGTETRSAKELFEIATRGALEHRRRDDFDLPLTIQVDVPEVPPEIQRPSPPIKEQPK
jgi:hypothetical protein